MDTIVLATFVFSGLMVIVNLNFKRMEVIGQQSLAWWIDNFTIWIYPVPLVTLVVLCWYWFLVDRHRLE